jgi:hypothetical protein
MMLKACQTMGQLHYYEMRDEGREEGYHACVSVSENPVQLKSHVSPQRHNALRISIVSECGLIVGWFIFSNNTNFSHLRLEPPATSPRSPR